MKHYRVEPYAVAADIYSAPGTCGRGGWTWYTGAAGWMYRVTIEHVLGIKREGEWLRIEPCVPAGWPGYKVTLRIEGADTRSRSTTAVGPGCGVVSVAVDGTPAADGRVHLEPGSGRHTVQVVLGRLVRLAGAQRGCGACVAPALGSRPAFA